MRTIKGNGSLYGTHPFYWYFTSGIPALTGILLPVLIYDGIATCDRARRNLWTIVVCYVVTHSWSEHKEFRFLLPILPIFCLICGGRIQNMVIGLKPSRINQIMIACAGLNLIAILYLGLFHQRAPIDVNQAIIKAVATRHNINDKSTKQPAYVRVHYLMGCHSTPLLSHLHDPPTKFVTLFLDCSPSCRATPDIDCESDVFSEDPRGFMKTAYDFECSKGDDDKTCTVTGKDIFPDYIVCYSSDLTEMKANLELMDMKEIGRFKNSINGVNIGKQFLLGGDPSLITSFTKIGFFRDVLTLTLEEIILFQKHV